MEELAPAGIPNGNGHHFHHQSSLATNHRLRKPGRVSRPRARRADALASGARVSSEQVQTQQVQQTLTPTQTPCTDFDKAYFHSYAHLSIHEEMIKDRLRTETYRSAIMQHQDYIKDKVVVDVGCGTGILSIFCAQAGAKRVYAVDASDIAAQASEVVKANNLSETVIVLHGRVEDVEINEEVDVIISEWMGYMLMYESMLGSVITARDRWLKPGGLILPSIATLYMAPVTHPDRYGESIDFWRNVYGIDMSPLVPLAKQCAFEEPSVETISGENVLTWPHVVKLVDCYTVTNQELESITTKFNFQSMLRAPFHGFAFWFDVEFIGPGTFSAYSDSPPQQYSNPTIEGSQRTKRANPNKALILSTAPEDPPTHWEQTLIYFYEPIEVEQDQHIEGSVTLSQSRENCRFINIHLEYTWSIFREGVCIEMIILHSSVQVHWCHYSNGKAPNNL
ncbi:probable protein arginine N-methyltransferase 6 isoform X1 [Daucus carota subsp. sativus]|uniref:probable protein arginine N-methyltransferase 6 isoform X1 n=1 Tax=Daucus carota subsp. sativus TaxID=79200 RepID=UPI0007EF1A4F|nr:PREDICTED: probable protein arginine N-methyltransferase 6 isoform X1 [Daucus carota subsp. sativus]